MTEFSVSLEGYFSEDDKHLKELSSPVKRVVIVGVGLLGASILLALRDKYPESIVYIFDIDPTARKYISDAQLSDGVYEKIGDLPPCDLAVVCTPANSVLPTIRALRPVLVPMTVVTDVASVKGPIAREVAQLLPAGVHYVPAHPMAGGSFGGAASGRSDLFQNRSVILTPLETTAAWAIAYVEDFWRGLGARLGRTSPEHHDELVALTSHLPHLIAYAMMDTLGRQAPDGRADIFIGRSLEDLIRLGSANPSIWRDIFHMNSARILGQLDVFEEVLRAWREALSSRSEADVAACVGQACASATKFRLRDGGVRHG